MGVERFFDGGRNGDQPVEMHLGGYADESRDVKQAAGMEEGVVGGGIGRAMGGHEGAVGVGFGQARPRVRVRVRDAPAKHRAISDFLRRVLAVAVGAADGRLTSAPEFLKSALFDENLSAGTRLRELGEAVGYYHEFKVVSIAKGLGAEGHDRYQHAMRQVRAGVGFGAAEHSVKALQIALSDNGLGGKPDEHGKLPGYKISFNFSRPPRPPGSGHPNSGSARGMYLAAHGPPEADKKDDHDEDCCEKFGGLGKCPQLAGVDIVTLPRGEIASHGKVGKKHQHPPGVEGVALDTHAFATGLMGELENASINRRTCDLAVVDAPGHSKHRLAVCCAEVWECGRCFCATPLMRSFDALGRLRLTRL